MYIYDHWKNLLWQTKSIPRVLNKFIVLRTYLLRLSWNHFHNKHSRLAHRRPSREPARCGAPLAAAGLQAGGVSRGPLPDLWVETWGPQSRWELARGRYGSQGGMSSACARLAPSDRSLNPCPHHKDTVLYYIALYYLILYINYFASSSL